MRLIDAILEVNRRRLAGDKTAFIAPAECVGALPLAALTCIDPRLNHLLPDALGVPDEQFIWLRNAGNVITGPTSSTMRSLALGCAVKGAREIAVIGHTDCQVCRTTMLQLLERLGSLGVDRHRLPENLVEYFGLFGSERQNVIRATDIIRSSPLIGANIPVHGLVIEIKTGGLECVVNGYNTPPPVIVPGKVGELFARAEYTIEKLTKIGDVAAAELKLPASKIGEFGASANEWLHQAERVAAAVLPAASGAAAAVPSASPAPTAPPNLPASLRDRARQSSAAGTTRPRNQR